jgi:IS6 family transposase
MSRQKPFEQHRFPAIVILCVVRMYLRYPLSYQDTVDLLAERRVVVAPHFTASRISIRSGGTTGSRAITRRSSVYWDVASPFEV